MKQKDKDLLLKDLCGRLQYGVKVLYEDNVFNIDYISSMYEEMHLDIVDNYTIDISEVKPYLFPMPSMTEDIKDEIYKETGLYDIMENDMVHIEAGTNFLDVCKLFNILNKHHLDYNNLIPKGLAKDATGLNIY